MSVIKLQTSFGVIKFRNNEATGKTFIRLPRVKGNGRAERVIIEPTETGFQYTLQLAAQQAESLRHYETAEAAWEGAKRQLKKLGALVKQA